MVLSTSPMIRLHNVQKSFGPKEVLTGVDLEVPRGESWVIIGGSGSGKSVLLKCILGLLSVTRGEIFLEGQKGPWQSDNSIFPRIGMLFQGGALFDSMTVIQNVAIGLITGLKKSKKEAYEIAFEKLKDVGLSKDVASLMPAELSGGMQKRVGLARAMATDPEILFFDEPTTGLDPIMRSVIDDLIVKCVKRLGAAAITITHDLVSAQNIADKVAMLYQGKIIWTGAADQLYDSGNPFVEQFVNGKLSGPIPIPGR